MAAKIQDADVKSSSDVTSDSRLINDTKIYVSSLSKRLDQAVAAGDFATGKPSSQQIVNLGIATSVGSNALTVAFKDNAGSDASSTSQIKIGFRSSTLATGSFVERTLSAASSLVVPSGATLGTVSGVQAILYVYAIDNAGTIEPAISNDFLLEESVYSTTILDTASDSPATLYSTTARTNVAIRMVGRIAITEATAGTWATNATILTPGDFGSLSRNGSPTVQRFTSGSGTYNTPSKVQYLTVRVVGGGGGGSGSGTASGGAGGTGTASTFGTSLLTANGGSGASYGSSGLAGGGGTTVNSPGIAMIAQAGGSGAGFSNTNTLITVSFVPSSGGSTPLGSTPSGPTGFSGTAGAANTGAGGGGGGASTGFANNLTGGGGGGGGYIEAIISLPTTSYSYAVGGGGSAGTAGTNGVTGGAGGSGYIEVVEYYK